VWGSEIEEREAAMITGNDRAARVLFQSVDRGGTDWLSMFLSDSRWAITRNGKRVAVGADDRKSIRLGIEQFRFLVAGGGIPVPKAPAEKV
jgi:hypothetical protein